MIFFTSHDDLEAHVCLEAILRRRYSRENSLYARVWWKNTSAATPSDASHSPKLGAATRAAWLALSTAAIDQNLTAPCAHCCALCVPCRNRGGF